MTKFKAGDRVRYNGSGVMAAVAGATAKVVESVENENDYICIEWFCDNLSKGQMDGNYYEHCFDLVQAYPTITAGSRVTNEHGAAGEVVSVINAANVKWDGGSTILYPIDSLTIEAAKTFGQTVQELRKAAGLPEFVVGDVVQATKDQTCILTKFVPHTVLRLEVDKIWLETEHGSRDYSIEQFGIQLVTPAPSAPAVATQPQELKYKQGDYVRFLSGEFKGRAAYVEAVDGHSTMLPYLVTMVDEYDGSWAFGTELESWVPRVGERVESKDKEETTSVGTVVGLDYDDEGPSITVAWDSKEDYGADAGPWGAEELLPYVPVQIDFKEGDIVEIQMGRFNGKVGIITHLEPIYVLPEGYSTSLPYDKSELKLAA